MGPQLTVRVLRRVTSCKSSQYFPMGPNNSSRSPDFQDGVHKTSEEGGADDPSLDAVLA